ncbi:MAG: TM0106 family RecB-like putative nuclease [Elusimicrobia bacterium]|nr:TM0106 family RecB-like putative nuclease [Elusimicrobiota bacterium]
MDILDTVYKKFSDNRLPSDSQDLRASKIYSLLQDEFGLWCFYNASRELAVSENGRYEQARSLRDKLVKDKWLHSRYPDAVRIESRKDPFKDTLSAMFSGINAIQHPHLWDLPAGMFGRANLLLRDNSAPSALGGYHYRIVQFKQALELKEHYALAGAFLNRILGKIQGFEPPEIKIMLREGEVDVIQRDWNHRLDAEMERWKNVRSSKTAPETSRPPNASSPPWRIYANRVAAERKDLIMLAGIGWDVRAKLKEVGIIDIPSVIAAGQAKINEIAPDNSAEVYGNALAYHLNAPILKREGFYPPRRGKRNIYFDFEASDDTHLSEPPHIYLIGTWENGFKTFVARGAGEEEKIFGDFLDYIGNPEDVSLYHWTDYEINQMKETASKYPKLKDRFEAIFKYCVDLKVAMQKAFYLPSPSFSLKAVAPAFGFKWRQTDCGAMDSMVYYWDWLKGDEPAIKKVITYNEDDCYAMFYVDEILSKAEVKKIS